MLEARNAGMDNFTNLYKRANADQKLRDIQIASRRDTLELSSGVTVSGVYAFIADRRMGVEIWNVSDIYNPSYVGNITSMDSGTSQYEYQDCEVDGNYLYIGVYEQKEIEIYDISKIDAPVFVSTLELDGRGQGIDVANGILYASTALASRDMETYRSEPKLYESGAGNGLEIWDVSDPAEPLRLSVKKFEGRTSCNISDVWDVEVIDNIAYVSNMLSGLWIVDVTDPVQPIITDNYRIVLHDGDEDYRSYDNSTYALPFNSDSESRGSVWHVAVGNGKLYITTQHAGIYEIQQDTFKKNTYSNPCNVTLSDNNKTEISKNGFSVDYIDLEGCVWTVVKGEKYFYAACGCRGIAVLDDNMTLIQYIETVGPARDVEIYGNYLFVAEMENGTSIYELNGMGLNLVSNCPVSSSKTSVEIQLTQYVNYIFVHTSLTGFDIWNISDRTNPQRVSASEYSPGRMDLGSLCEGLVDGKYVGIIGRTTEYWFYEEDGMLKLAAQGESTHYHEVSGSAAVGSYCFASAYIKSYYYYNPLNVESIEKGTTEEASFVGLCASNGSLLAVSRRGNGTISIYDVADIENINLIARCTTNNALGAPTLTEMTFILLTTIMA